MREIPWEPLPPDVAAWMGLDEVMVPYAHDLTLGVTDLHPDISQAPITTG